MLTNTQVYLAAIVYYFSGPFPLESDLFDSTVAIKQVFNILTLLVYVTQSNIIMLTMLALATQGPVRVLNAHLFINFLCKLVQSFLSLVIYIDDDLPGHPAGLMPTFIAFFVLFNALILPLYVWRQLAPLHINCIQITTA